ncbi:MAG: alpha-glucosidase/alpha-galactosidase [Deltaproteobacteria bacterium]|nr:alpha-glucosidase/alpha-galactosidase [Deltaproteobacteria bacterium]
MPQTRIVLIGAGSVCFGTSTFADLCRAGRRLAGSTIVLVDINPEGLGALEALFRRMVQAAGVDLTIEATTDRRRALPGAEFVVVSIAVDRERTWKLDFEVPRRHGVRHVLGENGGPGALFHAARNIPPMLAICRDLEALCPAALLVNFTNPEPRMCLAVSRYSKVRVVGLCHQVFHGVSAAAQVLGCAPADLDLKAAGINHFTWISDLRDRLTGADLYPEFRRRLAAMPPDFEPLCRQLHDVFGLYPATGDQHAGEYVAWAFGPVGEQGYDFAAAAAARQGMWDDLARVNAGTLPVARFLDVDSGERVVPLVCGVLENSNHYELAVDLPNRGHIANLPDGPIVEVPGMISGAGVRGLCVGPLPEGIAILCRRQMELASLAVDAAVHGDRTLALQALVLDPVVPDPAAARAILDELLAAERAWLPQFHGGPPAA